MVLLKRKNVIVVSSIAILTLLFLLLNNSSQLADPKPLDPKTKKIPLKDTTSFASTPQESPSSVKDTTNEDISSVSSVAIEPFMPQMANETLKAELGRATWRLFHTILARYPETPSDTERETLSQYIQLFVKVYPCGDCARHFSILLKKYPPQLSSRQVASVWGCHIHNKVNERLKKPQYDCTTILEDYDCGCGADEEASAGGNGIEDSVDKEHLQFELSKEEKQLG